MIMIIINFHTSYYLVGTFAIAWVMCKFTEPIRLGIIIIFLKSDNTSVLLNEECIVKTITYTITTTTTATVSTTTTTTTTTTPTNLPLTSMLFLNL